MTAPAIAQTAVSAMRVELEITIQASRARVFDALAKDIAAWWGAPYHLSAKPQYLVLEPEIGGRFYETASDNESWLWATVTGIKFGEQLELMGTFGMDGAVQGLVAFQLQENNGATVVKMTHRAIGDFADDKAARYAEGWQDLIGVRLKAFAETGKRYGLGHEPPAGATS